MFVTYHPLFVFFWIRTAAGDSGLLIGMRFLYYYLTGSGGGHIQSLILASLALTMAAIAGRAG